MKKLAIIMAAIQLAICGPTVAHAASAKANDVAQIKALEDSLAKAINAADLDALMAVYTPDVFVFDLLPPRQYVGEKAWRENWAGFLKSSPKLQISDLSVESDGKIAYSHMIWDISSTDEKGAKLETVVRVTDVYRKNKGKWLIVQEHISVPVDFATGKPDMSSKP